MERNSAPVLAFGLAGIVPEVVWEVGKKFVFSTMPGWQERVFIWDAILRLAPVAGTLYTSDRGTKRLSKPDLEARVTLLFLRFIGRNARESTGSLKSMCLCFQVMSFATLRRASGCRF